MADRPAEPALTPASAALALAEAELAAAKAHRHPLTGTMPADRLIALLAAVVDGHQDKATAPQQPKE